MSPFCALHMRLFRYLSFRVSCDPVSEFRAPPVGAIQRGTPGCTEPQRALPPPGLCAREGAPAASLSLTSSERRRRHLLTQAEPGSAAAVGGRLARAVSPAALLGSPWAPGTVWTGHGVQRQPVSLRTPSVPSCTHDACSGCPGLSSLPRGTVCVQVTLSPCRRPSCTGICRLLLSGPECSYTDGTSWARGRV